ncbi:MAG: hypothetical protein CM15mP31_0050 [Gammaproteobacteria bacterium]|nr:MAG: hypothetical protein CM15mP31_0050 [Gammaproteobacteria bacterium]
MVALYSYTKGIKKAFTGTALKKFLYQFITRFGILNQELRLKVKKKKVKHAMKKGHSFLSEQIWNHFDMFLPFKMLSQK